MEMSAVALTYFPIVIFVLILLPWSLEIRKNVSNVLSRKYSKISQTITALKVEEDMDTLKDVVRVKVYGTARYSVKRDTGLNTKCYARK